MPQVAITKPLLLVMEEDVDIAVERLRPIAERLHRGCLIRIAAFVGAEGLVQLSAVCRKYDAKLSKVKLEVRRARLRLEKGLPPIDATIRRHSSAIADAMVLASNLPTELIVGEKKHLEAHGIDHLLP